MSFPINETGIDCCLDQIMGSNLMFSAKKIGTCFDAVWEKTERVKKV